MSYKLQLCILLAILALPFSASAEKPNVIIIVADDLGWADVGYHGSPIPTPNIDRLARTGVELDQFYVAPMCTPTRAALLTGRYWSRFGNTAPSNTLVLPLGTTTLASALKESGYDTCITGKWHLGSLPKWGARKFGFDQSYGSMAGGVGPWNHLYKKGTYSRTWHRNDELLEEEGHVTQLITDAAVRFIEEERTKPFFLYVPYTAPHHPLDEPKEWLERGRKADPKRPQYAACVMHMDDGIGRITKAVDKTGERENTLIVFFSDNGGTINPADGDNGRYPGTYPKGERLGLNTPLKGRKTQVYEGGIRVPAIVNWPGKLKPAKVGMPLHVIDWMPTVSKIVGYKPKGDLNWDGENIWPLLSGEKKKAPPRVLYWQGVGKRSAALRDGDWKLVVHRGKSARTELYDLAGDPDEGKNVSEQNKALVTRLSKQLDEQTKLDNDAVPEK